MSRWLRRRAARRDDGGAADAAGSVGTFDGHARATAAPSPIRTAVATAGVNGFGNGSSNGTSHLDVSADGWLAPSGPPAAEPPVGPVAAEPPPAPADGAAEVARVRRDYDDALTGAGLVLFQQVSPGVDGFHMSASMASVLGWDPLAFTAPGVLRSIVHPGDLATFDGLLPAEPGTPLDPWVDADAVIDLTSVGNGSTVADAATEPVVLAEDDEPAAPVIRCRDARGAWRSIQVRLATGDSPTLLRGTLVDVTAEERRNETARRFAEIVEHDPSGCLVLEFLDRSDPASLVIRSANRSAHRMFDLDRRVVDGTPIGAVLGEASAQLVRHALFDVCHTGQSMTAERLSLGEVRGTYLDLRVDRLADGTLGMTVTDVTGTVALEERLRHQASHDALTGLPNRALLEERLAGSIAAASPAAPVALVVVDIEHLRDVNETLGLHLGDQLLVELGRRLVREVRGAAVVSRLGGDEFAVLTMPCTSDAEAIDRALAVRSALSRPFDVAGHLVECPTSIGVALAPTHADDGRSLLRVAQSALDAAKHEGTGFHVHEPTGAPSSISRLALLTELRQGLANRDLELHYQPVVDLRTGRVTKVEAQLRWQDDRGAERLPMEFVELAEQSGLIRPLTRWIVGEVATAAASLAESGHPLVVTTNVSMRNLCEPELDAFLHQIVESGELPTDLVELEVAETELMDDPALAHETLSRLAELGLRFVVDEFGTGYTSLSTMQHLPVVGLKIDRSFISVVATDPSDAAIVRSTVELSHELGLSVGAAGVPDEDVLSQLASFGCDVAQGVHLSGPVTMDDLPDRISQLESAVRGWIGSAEVPQT